MIEVCLICVISLRGSYEFSDPNELRPLPRRSAVPPVVADPHAKVSPDFSIPQILAEPSARRHQY